jgi:hypothetical protein
MTMVTIAPFAALAIEGISFRGGADCPATTSERKKMARRVLFVIRFAMALFLCAANSSEISRPLRGETAENGRFESGSMIVVDVLSDYGTYLKELI